MVNNDIYIYIYIDIDIYITRGHSHSSWLEHTEMRTKPRGDHMIFFSPPSRLQGSPSWLMYYPLVI